MISAVTRSPDLSSDDSSDRDDLIPLAQTGYYSSRENLAFEKEFLDHLNALNTETGFTFDPAWVKKKRHAYYASKKNRMDSEELDGQLRVIFDAFTQKNRLHILTGPPGAAKTVVAALWVKLAREHHSDIPVTLITQEKPALNRIHEKIGYQPAELLLIDDLLKDGRTPQQNAIILIDEVGLLGTQTLARLFAVLRRHDPAKIILIGDDKQLLPAEAGHPFRWMRESGKIPVAELMFPYRQKNPDLRQAVQDLYAGKVASALDVLPHGFFTKDELLNEARRILQDMPPEKSMVLVHGDAFIRERLQIVSPGFRIYSLTAAQGLAIDQTVLILSAPITLSEFLVGCSRARHRVTILIDTSCYADRDALLTSLRDYPKSLMALDIVDEDALLQIVD